MQIILLDKVANLGGLGDVVKVKDGYARNYLIPQGMAKRATSSNMAEFEARRAELERIQAEKLAAAQELGGKLEGLMVQITRKAAWTVVFSARSPMPMLPKRWKPRVSASTRPRCACRGSDQGRWRYRSAGFAALRRNGRDHRIGTRRAVSAISYCQRGCRWAAFCFVLQDSELLRLQIHVHSPSSS